MPGETGGREGGWKGELVEDDRITSVLSAGYTGEFFTVWNIQGRTSPNAAVMNIKELEGELEGERKYESVALALY